MTSDEKKQMTDLKFAVVVLFIGFVTMLVLSMRTQGQAGQDVQMWELMNDPPMLEGDIPVTHQLKFSVDGNVDVLYGTMLFNRWEPGSTVYILTTNLETGRRRFGKVVVASPADEPPEKYFPKEEGGQ